MTKRDQKNYEHLLARIKALKGRLEDCHKNASFRPEIVRELEMLKWVKGKLGKILGNYISD